MTTTRWLCAAIALAAGTIIFAACDDGGGGDGASQTATNGDGADDPDARDLSAIAAQFRDASFRGEYNLTGASAEEDGFTNARLVIYKDGQDRLRFDLSAEQDGEETELLFIETPDTSAFCLRNAGEFGILLGVPEGEGVCFNDDPGGEDAAGAGDYSEIIEDIESGEGEIIERSEREIAGVQADCYRIRDADGNVSDVCFSEEGYLLATKEPDGTGLEAISISGEVSDDDFSLPYEVRDFPDLDTTE
jgi:hypothetical protein